MGSAPVRVRCARSATRRSRRRLAPANRACARGLPPMAAPPLPRPTRRAPLRSSSPRGRWDRPQHRQLLARPAVGVVLIERRLLEEVLAQEAPGAKHDALGGRERVGTEELYDLQELRLALQQLAHPGAMLLPVRSDFTPEPAGEVVE